MIKKKYYCIVCDKTFVVEVFEEGEERDKGLHGSPVRCPYCGGLQIKPY
jgi:DNA-directed RNA polymerase subunit RPC12/RpoP